MKINFFLFILLSVFSVFFIIFSCSQGFEDVSSVNTNLTRPYTVSTIEESFTTSITTTSTLVVDSTTTIEEVTTSNGTTTTSIEGGSTTSTTNGTTTTTINYHLEGLLINEWGDAGTGVDYIEIKNFGSSSVTITDSNFKVKYGATLGTTITLTDYLDDNSDDPANKIPTSGGVTINNGEIFLIVESDVTLTNITTIRGYDSFTGKIFLSTESTLIGTNKRLSDNYALLEDNLGNTWSQTPVPADFSSEVGTSTYSYLSSAFIYETDDTTNILLWGNGTATSSRSTGIENPVAPTPTTTTSTTSTTIETTTTNGSTTTTIGGSGPKVVIYAVAAGGPGGATDELVILTNIGDMEQNLNNWKIKYSSATNNPDGGTSSLVYTFSSYILNPGSYVLVTRSGYNSSSWFGNTAPDLTNDSSTYGFASTGGHVFILDDSNNIMDILGYGTASNPEGTAISAASDRLIYRKDPVSDTDDNSVDFEVNSTAGGTLRNSTD